MLGLLHICAAQNQERAPGRVPFSLAITVGHTTIKSGSKIVLDVVIKNTSDLQIPTPMDVRQLGIMVAVERAGGAAATLTDLGRQWNEAGGWVTSSPYFPMAPGKSVHKQIVVSELYDMTNPGKYSIHLQRGDLASNTITVTVVAP